MQNNLVCLGYDSSLRLKNFQGSEQFRRQLLNSLRFKLAKEGELLEHLLTNYLEEGDQEVLDNVKFLTPNFDTLSRILADPCKFAKGEGLGMKRWHYNFSLLEVILFTPQKVQQILSYDGQSFTEEQFAKFVNKVFDLNFC